MCTNNYTFWLADHRLDTSTTGTHIFEEGLVLCVGGWSLCTLHALQLLLPWFAGAMTDQRWLLHQALPAFWKGSKGLGLLLCLGCTCPTGAWHWSHNIGLWADTVCTCGTLCAYTQKTSFPAILLLSHHVFIVMEMCLLSSCLATDQTLSHVYPAIA